MVLSLARPLPVKESITSILRRAENLSADNSKKHDFILRRRHKLPGTTPENGLIQVSPPPYIRLPSSPSLSRKSPQPTMDFEKIGTFFHLTSKLFSPPTTTELQACWELCRLHNNIGFWVVWLPTAWSIAMAYRAQAELTAVDALLRAAIYVPLCFGVKSLIMTIDDVLDYDIDILVERTKDRAIPRGAISLRRAWVFFAIQVVLGIALAFKVLSRTALYTSMVVWPLYIIYPTCKRWTNLAPIPLGLMFKVGIFMGWSDLSVDGTIPWRTLAPVYIGACLWTITYETVYQHQDKLDDVKIGINSPALLCRQYTVPICTVTAVGFFSLLAYGGWLNGQGVAFFVGIAVAAVELMRVLLRTDVDRPAQCKRFFLDTPRVGQIVLAGLVVDAVVQRHLQMSA